MALPLAAIGAGVSALGAVKGLFGGGGDAKRAARARRAAIAALRASRPTGYLTPADYRASELTRGRLSQGVTAAAGQEGAEINRRFLARGLGGSPAEERSRARLNQQRLLGIQGAGESAEEQLYNIRTGREGFEREKALAIFGAEVGEASREAERAKAEQGAFWNSLNEFMPTILSSTTKTPALPGYQAAIDRGPDIVFPGYESIRPLGNTGYVPGGD